MDKHKRKIDHRVTRVVVTEEEILQRIKELGAWVDKTYQDEPKELILVGLLKGCLPFLAELIKNVTVDHTLDFMIASSYAGSSKSSGNVKIVLDLASNISGKNILIVEDIVDAGITFKRVLDLLKSRNPKSLRIVSLLDRPINRKVPVTVDKAGFIISEDYFLVGYGLDYKEQLRNLPYIGIFDLKYL